MKSADRILVVGEALIDLVRADGYPERSHPGGSPFNVAVALARLEVPVALLTRYGADAEGRMLAGHLAGNAVELAADPVDAMPTSLAIARLQPDGGAIYDFDLHWALPAAAHLSQDAVAVHTGSIAAVIEPGADAVAGLMHRYRDRATLTYDPNCRPALMGSPAEALVRIEPLVPAADLVKASAEDLGWLYPGRDWRDSAIAWQSTGPAMVIVTDGAGGSWAVTGHGEVSVAAWPVPVVDTVGAGDAFMAGLLHALHARDLLGAPRREALRALDLDTLREVMGHATAVAALTVQRAGADSPRLRELPAD